MDKIDVTLSFELKRTEAILNPLTLKTAMTVINT